MDVIDAAKIKERGCWLKTLHPSKTQIVRDMMRQLICKADSQYCTAPVLAFVPDF